MGTTVTVRKGIGIRRLTDTIQATGQNPTPGTFTFRASSHCKGGTHSGGEILLGNSAATSPVLVRTTLEVA